MNSNAFAAIGLGSFLVAACGPASEWQYTENLDQLRDTKSVTARLSSVEKPPSGGLRSQPEELIVTKDDDGKILAYFTTDCLNIDGAENYIRFDDGEILELDCNVAYWRLTLGEKYRQPFLTDSQIDILLNSDTLIFERPITNGSGQTIARTQYEFNVRGLKL